MLKQTQDKYGNTIYQKENSIYLYLAEKQQTRKLGSISPRKELFIRRFNKHIFRKLNAYGFCYNLLTQLPPTMPVIIKEEDGTQLETTVGYILQNGDAKQFLTDGFELQIFLNRSLFSKK